ncbi:MAG: hypothetical protein H6738_06565 [Alphaproteobacteria bacterium]|nr:hypothetical protein [Alphaproteobacteria bacterium]MCB9696424.1 hypothetical protein [Alphaproteobacteria bacterium]
MIDSVRAWRDRLRATDPADHRGLLSVGGIRAVWTDALDALTDEALEQIASAPGTPWASAAMAVPRTVPTSPVEWCAVLLTRGTEVTLKPPSTHPGVVPLLVEAARAVDLPLAADADRSSLLRAELAVVQGGDEAVAAVRAARGDRPTLGFGHRFSVAWIRDPRSMVGLAADTARFDGRGCMSPVLALTDLGLEEAAEALGEAMAAQALALPRGSLLPEEGAALREHRARARVGGGLLAGPDWAVLVGPLPDDEPPGLVRAIRLAHADRATAAAWLAARRDQLSTVGTDDPELRLPGVRVCAPGAMQRPPLHRIHDGVDWVSLAVARPQNPWVV